MAKPTSKSARTLVITGTLGVGKSEAGNFFAGKRLFDTGIGFGSVTNKSQAETCTLAGKPYIIIDTPGFMDAMSEGKLSFEEFSHALVLARDGVDAFGLVIDTTKRIDYSVVAVLKELLSSFAEVIPYIFVLFTKVQHLGKEESIQRQRIEEMLAGNCPTAFKAFLDKIDNKYMLLESVNYDNRSNYHETKCNELTKIVDQIQKDCQNTVLQLKLMKIAKEVYERKRIAIGSGKSQNHTQAKVYNAAVEELHSKLKQAGNSNMHLARRGEMRKFWEQTCETTGTLLGVAIGGAVGTFMGNPAIGVTVGSISGKLGGKLVGKAITKVASICSIQ